MTTENGEPIQESGSQLREKLETTIAANKALQAKLAEKVVTGLKFVKADDLKEVDFDQMEARAAEIESQRAEQQNEVLKQALADRGLEGDDLDAALAKLVAKGESPEQTAQPTRSPFARTGALGGSPVGAAPDTNVRGQSRIEAALHSGSQK